MKEETAIILCFYMTKFHNPKLPNVEFMAHLIFFNYIESK